MSFMFPAFRQLRHISCQNLVKRGQIQTAHRLLCSKVTMADAGDYKIEHDLKKSEFYIDIGSERALLQYELKGNVYDLTHTFTPPTLRGSGIAQVLAHRAFDHVVDSGAKMKLTCSYLEYLNNKEKNPKYKPHIVEN